MAAQTNPGKVPKFLLPRVRAITQELNLGPQGLSHQTPRQSTKATHLTVTSDCTSHKLVVTELSGVYGPKTVGLLALAMHPASTPVPDVTNARTSHPLPAPIRLAPQAKPSVHALQWSAIAHYNRNPVRVGLRHALQPLWHLQPKRKSLSVR